MKTKSPQTAADLTAKQNAILKTEYRKNGVMIAFSNFSTPDFLGLCFEFTVSGELFKSIICDGKARRADRKILIKAAFLCFEMDSLKEMEIGGKKLRGAFFFSNKTEAK